MTRTTIAVCIVAGLVTTALVRGSGVPTSGQAEGSPASRQDRLVEMRHHFAQVLHIHEAVVRGDLQAAREPARELARIPVPPAVPPASDTFVVAIREAGRRAADATTLVGAARETVAMVNECANCHAAVGIAPARPAPERKDVLGLVGEMIEHQSAADEMLLGLLTRSSTRWNQGALRLQSAVLRPSQLPPDEKLTPEIQGAETRIRQLADRAGKAATPDSRAETYVQLLTSCAECHSLYRGMSRPRAGL